MIAAIRSWWTEGVMGAVRCSVKWRGRDYATVRRVGFLPSWHVEGTVVGLRLGLANGRAEGSEDGERRSPMAGAAAPA